MFPITEAWDGNEIDDAVLEEYNASVMELSMKTVNNATFKAQQQGRTKQADHMKQMWLNSVHRDKKNEASEDQNKDKKPGFVKKAAAAAGAGYLVYKGGKYLYNKAKEKVNDYRYRHASYGIG